jgi:hypothetical protein
MRFKLRNHVAQLLFRSFKAFLREYRSNHCGNHSLLFAGDMAKDVSHTVDTATLPACAGQDFCYGVFQSLVRIGNHKPNSGKTATYKSPQKFLPKGAGFAHANVKAQYMAGTVVVHRNGDYKGHSLNVTALSYFRKSRVRRTEFFQRQPPCSSRLWKKTQRNFLQLVSCIPFEIDDRLKQADSAAAYRTDLALPLQKAPSYELPIWELTVEKQYTEQCP